MAFCRTVFVRGKNVEGSRVDGEGVVLERCELEVNVTRPNGRNKGKEQEKHLCVKRCFLVCFIYFSLISFRCLQKSTFLQTSTLMHVNAFLDMLTVNKLFFQGTTTLRKSLLTIYFALQLFSSSTKFL